jgi:hypothetical protein
MALGWPNRTWWTWLWDGMYTTRGITVDLFFLFAALTGLFALGWLVRRRPTGHDLRLSAVAIGGWFVIERTGPLLLSPNALSTKSAILAGLIALGVALIAILVSLARGTRLAGLAAVPLLALALHQLDKAGVILLIAGLSLLLLLGANAWPRPPRMAT